MFLPSHWRQIRSITTNHYWQLLRLPRAQDCKRTPVWIDCPEMWDPQSFHSPWIYFIVVVIRNKWNPYLSIWLLLIWYLNHKRQMTLIHVFGRTFEVMQIADDVFYMPANLRSCSIFTTVSRALQRYWCKDGSTVYVNRVSFVNSPVRLWPLIVAYSWKLELLTFQFYIFFVGE